MKITKTCKSCDEEFTTYTSDTLVRCYDCIKKRRDARALLPPKVATNRMIYTDAYSKRRNREIKQEMKDLGNKYVQAQKNKI